MPLNEEITNNFTDGVLFDEAINNRGNIPNTPATYILWSNQPFGRLHNQSQVLYIGKTQKLGGTDDTCRLYSYRYPPTDREQNIRKVIGILTELGHRIKLRWCTNPPGNLDVSAYESTLLQMSLDEHLELPPLNRRQ